MAKVKSVQPLIKLSDQGTYLVLISPETIPHLVVVRNGKYYSLTNKKSVIGEDFNPYLAFLKRSNRKVLFLELDVINGDIKNSYESYQKVNSKDTTCLSPIKDWLSIEESIQFVYELIPMLYLKEMIKETYHINMGDIIVEGGDFVLSQYSKADIYSYIDKLNRKYV